MVSLSSRHWIESQLRSDLEAARERLGKADSTERPEARERYKEALNRFTAFVVRGEVPAAWIGPGW